MWRERDGEREGEVRIMKVVLGLQLVPKALNAFDLPDAIWKIISEF